MKRLLKPAVALVAVIGLMSFLATPSSASTGTLTGGTLTVNLTPPLVTTFGTGGTGVTCGTGTTASSITALDSSTGTSGSTGVSGTLAINIWSAFTYQSVWYEFTGTLTGTYTSLHNADSTYTVTVHLTMSNGRIRETSATNQCSSTGTIKASVVSVTSMTLTGTASLTAVHPGPVGTIHLATTTAANVDCFGCIAPFSALGTSTATIASLTAALA